MRIGRGTAAFAFLLAMGRASLAAQTVLCPGGPGEAPRWVHDEKDCQAGPTARQKDPREKSAERRALDARKIRDQLAADRQKAASNPTLGDTLAYALPAGLAAAAAGLIAHSQAAGAPAPRVPATYGELRGNPDPAEQWRNFSKRFIEEVVALKLQSRASARGIGIVDITPKKAGKVAGLPPPSAGRAPEPIVAPPLKREGLAAGSAGISTKASAGAAYPRKAEGAASSISSTEGSARPGSRAKEKIDGAPGSLPADTYGRAGGTKEFSMADLFGGNEPTTEGTKAKGTAEGQVADLREGEELDLFEKALGKVEEEMPAQAAPMLRPEENASLFAQITAQYRKRERVLQP